MTAPKLLCIATAVTLSIGCGTTPKKADDPAPKTTPKETVKAAPYDTTTPVGKKTAWFMNVIHNKNGELSVEDAKTYFADDFLKAVPADKLVLVTKQIAASAPLNIEKVVKQDANNLAMLVTAKNGMRLIMSVNVKPDAPHKIYGLLFQPAPQAVKPEDLPKSWMAIDSQIGKLAQRSQVYAAKIDPKTGTCTAIHDNSGAQAMALGSTFKLYILSAMAKAIDEGKFKWSDTIAIEDRYKSLPSGTMQNEKAGTKHPLKHFADKMISISDNTATDHLLFKVGRDKVEAHVEALKNTAKYNKPFMSTREMFAIKLGMDASKQEAFAKADEKTRRAQLKTITALPGLDKAAGWKAPRHIDTIEWFASAQALCTLHGNIVKNSTKPAYKSAMNSMAINDGGLKADKTNWPYVGYKGGSEPGVLHMSYLLQHKDGTWYSMTMALNDTQKQVETMKLIPLIQAGFRLLK